MKKELKTVSVSFRASPRFKQLLESAADSERRSQANLLEMLLLSYCEQKGLTDQPSSSSGSAITLKNRAENA